MPYSFRSEQWLPYPVETVFAFFADPENLPTLIPEWQKARIERVDRVAPPLRSNAVAPATAVGAGSRITLSLKAAPFLPFRLRWLAEIEEFVWNDHFCDRQITGPFAYWQHCHRMRSIDREGLNITMLSDELEYDLPLGPLGSLAHGLFVQKQIEATFAYRRERTVEALAAFAAKLPAPIPVPAAPSTRAS